VRPRRRAARRAAQRAPPGRWRRAAFCPYEALLTRQPCQATLGAGRRRAKTATWPASVRAQLPIGTTPGPWRSARASVTRLPGGGR
jgi:hypothetical protein